MRESFSRMRWEAPSRVHSHVVLGRGQAHHLCGRHERHRTRVPDQEALLVPLRRAGRVEQTIDGRAPRLRVGEVMDRTGVRPVEPRLVVRLEEVVDGLHLEGLHGELLEGGHEDHRRHPRQADGVDHLEPVQPRHLHVEKDDVHIEPAQHLDRLRPVRRFAHDLCARLGRQVRAQLGAGRRLVIGDQDAHVHEGTSSARAGRKGISTVITRPPSGASDASSW